MLTDSSCAVGVWAQLKELKMFLTHILIEKESSAETLCSIQTLVGFSLVEGFLMYLINEVPEGC